jgi:XrtJ-associated TM-motif-TM protein
MKHLYSLLALGVLSFALITPLHAQTDGCVDSPENPTALLALVGTAGACGAVLRQRMKARTKK